MPISRYVDQIRGISSSLTTDQIRLSGSTTGLAGLLGPERPARLTKKRNKYGIKDVIWMIANMNASGERDIKRTIDVPSCTKFAATKFLQFVGIAVWCAGRFEQGVQNALSIECTQRELHFGDLPEDFDGYRILFVSDLHLDSLSGLARKVKNILSKKKIDLVLFGGDYFCREKNISRVELSKLRDVIDSIQSKDGAYAILGNHDSSEVEAQIRDLGIAVLRNETATVRRERSEIRLTGLEDVHHRRTQQAVDALGQQFEGFRIALVHSPEIVEEAAQAGISLYLAGHTHGGQICLRGGVPIVTNISSKRIFAKGVWKCDGMTGFTSSGVGVSGLPLRFNSRGEVAEITLRSLTVQ